MSEIETRKEELLDELFDAVSDLHHYMGGMLEDMKRKKYNIEEASGDMIIFDNSGISDILNELHELSESLQEDDFEEEDLHEQTTEEIPVTVSVWDHYAKGATK